jgi:hypothetical protein
MRKVLIVVLVAAIVGIVLIFNLSKATPESVCISAFETKFGEEFANPKVKEKTWNSISFDISGYYSGGEWTCALSNNPVEFKSGQLLPRNSKMIWFSAEDLSGN